MDKMKSLTSPDYLSNNVALLESVQNGSAVCTGVKAAAVTIFNAHDNIINGVGEWAGRNFNPFSYISFIDFFPPAAALSFNSGIFSTLTLMLL